ncbi:MAG: zinc-dependent metalloprotease [Beutenbergiaceae bacterium]
MNEDREQWRKMLESVLGPQAAEEAMRALEASGADPAEWARASGIDANPQALAAAMAQMQQILASDDGGESDWRFARDVARQAAHGGGDPTPTTSQQAKVRSALSVADLWLDAATDLPPSGGPQIAASRAEWVERTLPTWRAVADPIAVSVAEALAGVLAQQLDGDLPPELAVAGGVDLPRMVTKFGRLGFAMQVGQGTGTLAREVFGGTDIGLPLLTEPGLLLVPANIEQFAQGLDAQPEEVWQLLAVREAAHARLFTSVPWLRAHLLGAVEAYARGVQIDGEQLEEAVRSIDPTDVEQLRNALGQGIFAPQASPEQQRVLLRLETALALVEGWVEEVTAAAVAPHLPHAVPLREMLRRRRAAGGPAEDTFKQLVGLELRPRRAREAARLWQIITAEQGPAGRDALWSQLDLFPTAEDLDDPENFFARRAETDEVTADLDAALEQILGGDQDPPADPPAAP